MSNEKDSSDNQEKSLFLSSESQSQELNARISAESWGDFIKSSFDLFLPELKEKINLKSYSPESWTKFSQAIIYHKPKSLSNLFNQETINENKNKDSDNNIIIIKKY